MIFSKCIQLSNYHQDPFLEQFHYLKQAALCHFAINPTQLLVEARTDVLSVSRDLPFLDISY